MTEAIIGLLIMALLLSVATNYYKSKKIKELKESQHKVINMGVTQETAEDQCSNFEVVYKLYIDNLVENTELLLKEFSHMHNDSQKIFIKELHKRKKNNHAHESKKDDKELTLDDLDKMNIGG